MKQQLKRCHQKILPGDNEVGKESESNNSVQSKLNFEYTA